MLENWLTDLGAAAGKRQELAWIAWIVQTDRHERLALVMVYGINGFSLVWGTMRCERVYKDRLFVVPS